MVEGRVSTAPAPADSELPSPRVMAAGLAALRIFFGLIFLVNGLAKVFDWRFVEWGPYRAILIDREFARGIIANEVFERNDGRGTLLPFLRSPAQFLLDNWDWIGWMVTVVEIGVGVMLILGLATRLAALVGLGQQVSLALVYFSSGRWMFEQPHEYVPLVVFALVPVGRYWGLDARVRRATGWTGRGWRGWPL
jgi:thiosulfate dehydrogenase [quinone] large subunit